MTDKENLTFSQFIPNLHIHLTSKSTLIQYSGPRITLRIKFPKCASFLYIQKIIFFTSHLPLCAFTQLSYRIIISLFPPGTFLTVYKVYEGFGILWGTVNEQRFNQLGYTSHYTLPYKVCGRGSQTFSLKGKMGLQLYLKGPDNLETWKK